MVKNQFAFLCWSSSPCVRGSDNWYFAFEPEILDKILVFPGITGLALKVDEVRNLKHVNLRKQALAWMVTDRS